MNRRSFLRMFGVVAAWFGFGGKLPAEPRFVSLPRASGMSYTVGTSFVAEANGAIVAWTEQADGLHIFNVNGRSVADIVHPGHEATFAGLTLRCPKQMEA